MNVQDVLGKLQLNSSAGLVGIDIGLSGVKSCELKKIAGGNYAITAFGFSPLQEGTIVDDEFHNRDALTRAIKESLSKGKISNKNVCYGFPFANTIIKKMKAPPGTKQEIEDHISWEAEQFIPFGADNAIISIYITNVKDKDGVEVIMVAAKQDLVENYDAVLREAGLNCKIIDLQSIALINIFEHSYKEELAEYRKGTLIVDFGAHATKIIVYREDMPIFSKTITYGGIAITEAIQRQVGLGFEEAEDLKLMRDDQGNPPDEILSILKDSAEKILQMVKDASSFYLSQSSQEKVHRCMVTGGNLQLPGIMEGMASLTGMSVEVLDPLKRIKVGNKHLTEEILNQIMYVGAVPIGLALRGYIK
jgi:type IV pilus assembly protein PilM